MLNYKLSLTIALLLNAASAIRFTDLIDDADVEVSNTLSTYAHETT